MIDVGAKYLEVKTAVEAQAGSRPVKIVGATKMVPADRIEEAFRAGVRIFGENRIQEAIPKIERLQSLGAQWHFIGHLQSNKAAQAVRYFSCIQSVDTLKLLREIDRQAGKLGKRLDVLLEVNMGSEESKHGFEAEELAGALEAGKEMQSCTVIGLMAIPPFFENAEQVRPYFRRLRELRDLNQPQFPRLTELSMGMSHDYLVAIQEEATIVRVGTAIFGERPKRQ